jgi:hypothetical protein
MMKELLDNHGPIINKTFFEDLRNENKQSMNGTLKNQLVEQQKLNKKQALALKYS